MSRVKDYYLYNDDCTADYYSNSLQQEQKTSSRSKQLYSESSLSEKAGSKSRRTKQAISPRRGSGTAKMLEAKTAGSVASD